MSSSLKHPTHHPLRPQPLTNNTVDMSAIYFEKIQDISEPSATHLTDISSQEETSPERCFDISFSARADSHEDLHNYWRNEVADEEDPPSHLSDIQDDIAPGCSTCRGHLQAFDSSRINFPQTNWEAYEDWTWQPGGWHRVEKGDRWRMGQVVSNVPNYVHVESDIHVEGITVLGDCQTNDDEEDDGDVHAEDHEAEDHGAIGDPSIEETSDPVPEQKFGYSTDDLYTGSGWDFYSDNGVPYTPMYGTQQSHPVVQPQAADGAGMPRSRCRRLLQKFSVNMEQGLAKMNRFIRLIRPAMSS